MDRTMGRLCRRMGNVCVLDLSFENTCLNKGVGFISRQCLRVSLVLHG